MHQPDPQRVEYRVGHGDQHHVAGGHAARTAHIKKQWNRQLHQPHKQQDQHMLPRRHGDDAAGADGNKSEQPTQEQRRFHVESPVASQGHTLGRKAGGHSQTGQHAHETGRLRLSFAQRNHGDTQQRHQHGHVVNRWRALTQPQARDQGCKQAGCRGEARNSGHAALAQRKNVKRGAQREKSGG